MVAETFSAEERVVLATKAVTPFTVALEHRGGRHASS